MKLIFVWIIGFCLILPLSFAFEYPILYNDSFDNQTENLNWSISNPYCTINRHNSGILNCSSAGGYADFRRELVNISQSRGNYTIEFKLKIDASDNGEEFMDLSNSNHSNGTAPVGNTGNTGFGRNNADINEIVPGSGLGNILG